MIDRLYGGGELSREEYAYLIRNRGDDSARYLFSLAAKARERYYGNKIYIRGLIEFTNYCKNDCFYCGIRRSNKNADRYRLEVSEILDCCKEGFELGFRTFVLQGGEDGYFNDERLCRIVREIKRLCPGCAVTLSVGEKSRGSYQAYFDAGADRYLLRHETADVRHYEKLHPKELSAENRLRCLHDLKEIGYQVGTGFMVGSPYQTADELAMDMMFIKAFQPHMVGIGPFVPHHDTPFGNEKAGTLELTLFMLGLVRLTLPAALLPATTALGTIDPEGREKGVLAGANVVMPNLSPPSVRKKYQLYDNKICTGCESAQSVDDLRKRMSRIGYDVVVDRGDAVSISKN
ncbi:[FeFe] hydrogenase H-cluster radical SAM maturase HydE [Ruminococcus sp. Marseille-P6503]|uniref:[FeFe] hydrogenase H-cluster radical SAM maturase HydE n=1 Tax=Ruminococcus sp. Marseille-P6503 TaxID=2364796 RepID=UPI001FAAAC17|nr:[FeFe] hydrogenase H-cluster radical SAM maturase HydE [Ruminococcus sp. Marseille-P6503]